MLLLAQYALFNENELMSKLKGFFKKLSKKSKTSEDVEDEIEYEDEEVLSEEDGDEIVYEDDQDDNNDPEENTQISDNTSDEPIEHDQVEEIEPVFAQESTGGESTQVIDLNDLAGEMGDYELGEETVILDGIELSEELIPHESQNEGQIPADEDLKFPTVAQKEETESPTTSDLETASAEENNELPTTEDLEYPQVSTEEEEDFSQFAELTTETPIDQTDLEETIVFDDDEEVQEEEEEIPDFHEEPQEYEAPEATESYSLNIEEDENYQEVEETDPEAIDLSKNNFSVLDKVDQMKVRVADKFRNINKKELNSHEDSSGLHKPGLNFDGIKKSASKVNWVEIPTHFFSRAFRYDFHNWFQKAFILVLFIAIAKIVGMVYEGNQNYQKLTKKNYLSFDDSNKLTQEDINKIKQAQLFKTDQVVEKKPVIAKPVVDRNIICTTAKTKVKSSKVELLGAIVLQDSVKSLASIHVKSPKKELKNIRQGEILPGNYKVDKIERFKLIVKNLNTNECEYIENKKQKRKSKRYKKPVVLSPKKSAEFKKKNKKITGIDTDGNTFNIKKTFLQSKISNLQSLLTQARGIPIKNPDGTLHFKVVEIQPGSVFEYLGITDGDVITQINGTPIKDMSEVLKLFSRISKISALNLTINRGGDDVTQNYNIK